MNLTDWMDYSTKGTLGHEHDLLLGPLWGPRVVQGMKSGCTEVWSQWSCLLCYRFTFLSNKESECVPELRTESSGCVEQQTHSIFTGAGEAGPGQGVSWWADTALWGPDMSLLLVHTPSYTSEDNLVKMITWVINCLLLNITSRNFASKYSFYKNQ